MNPNRWKCGESGCMAIAIGCGSAIGLRALGWQVILKTELSPFTNTPAPPTIRCPVHRTDGIPGDAAAKSTQALLEAAEAEEHRCPICEFGDPVEDTPKLTRWSCGHWINKRCKDSHCSLPAGHVGAHEMGLYVRVPK